MADGPKVQSFIAVTQLRILRLHLSLVWSLSTWQPIYFKRSRSWVKGQGPPIVKTSVPFIKSGSPNSKAASEFWPAARQQHFLRLCSMNLAKNT